jgi:hypothetical protein
MQVANFIKMDDNILRAGSWGSGGSNIEGLPPDRMGEDQGEGRNVETRDEQICLEMLVKEMDTWQWGM